MTDLGMNLKLKEEIGTPITSDNSVHSETLSNVLVAENSAFHAITPIVVCLYSHHHLLSPLHATQCLIKLFRV